MPPTIATARLEARITPDLHAILKRAAELEGRTLTDFVVAAVQVAAKQAIEQPDVVRLSMADQACFAVVAGLIGFHNAVPADRKVRAGGGAACVGARAPWYRWWSS